MRVKTAILILGIEIPMIITAIPTISSQMWWAQSSKTQNGVGIMQPTTASDLFLMSLNRIWLQITAGGIGIILIDVVFFLVKRKK
jgi:hypothetical protein